MTDAIEGLRVTRLTKKRLEDVYHAAIARAGTQDEETAA